MARPKAKPESAPWVANQIEQRATVSLIPYANNARTHSDEQIEQLANSIKEFGFTIPVLVDETGTIIAGHGRVLAAQKIGLPNVPVITAPPTWSEAKRRAYVLADNKLALNAEWDVDALARELAAITALESVGELEFSVGIIGFSDDDLARLLDDASQAELQKIATAAEEDAPPPVVGAAAGDENTSFSTPLTHEEATTVHAAIRVAKRIGGHTTAGSALAAICGEWMGANDA